MFLKASRDTRFWDDKPTQIQGNKMTPKKAVAGGVLVVVLVEKTTLAKPNFKSNPPSIRGDVVEVAGGAYLQSLLDDKIVRLPDAEEMQAEKEKEIAQVAHQIATEMAVIQEQFLAANPDANLSPGEIFYRDADIPVPIANRLWDAGFTSKATIRASFQRYGFDNIMAVKGMGETRARKLLLWAGELSEVLDIEKSPTIQADSDDE